jgi:hypothetical protein
VTEQSKPIEYYCELCECDLVFHSTTAFGPIHVHAHNGAVACVWPAPNWSLYGTNAKPVRRI